ncbi:MAG: ribonuclease III [Oscillospiraceae bacterium]|nr:ribonuclease III [Oscillospiraceae bacterium]
MGDSIYEKCVRMRLVTLTSMPAGRLHNISVKVVCAAFQAQASQEIMDMLSENELSVFKRGRNAHGNTVPKSANAQDYRKATGLEALFGYLYLTAKEDRIEELFDVIWKLFVSSFDEYSFNNS